MLKVYTSVLAFDEITYEESSREATEEEIDLIACEAQDEGLWKDTYSEEESFDTEEEEEEEGDEKDEDDDWIEQDSYTDRDVAYSIHKCSSSSESYTSDNQASDDESIGDSYTPKRNGSIQRIAWKIIPSDDEAIED
jgi:hypothetical protein